MKLTQEQYQRYGRHIILPEIGEEGQKKLLASKVLLIGAGGLGAPLSLYLAAAGVGTIGIVDFDKIELSNLQRQIIHKTQDVGKSKVDSAEQGIRAINPDVQVHKYKTHINSENAFEIIKDYDIVIDGTDNFPTRYLVNDACVLLKKVNIYGSIFRFDGQATVFKPFEGPCYRCLYPEPPPPGMVPSCAEGGVLGILPGIIGLIQATEAIKIITGQGESLIGRLLTFDALKMKFRELKLRRDSQCPLCGDHPTIHQLIDYQEFCGYKSQETEVIEEKNAGISELPVQELKKRIDQNSQSVFILDVREPYEYEIVNIPGSVLIPLGQIQNRISELELYKNSSIVVHCHHGGRSRKACEILKSKGFKKVENLAGGIHEWAMQIDQELPTY